MSPPGCAHTQRVIGVHKHFFAKTDFPASDCKSDFEVLKSHLQAYPTAQLGVWTWVIVQSNHWKDLGRDLGLDAASPAYTAIEDRLTLLDESMLLQRDANRKRGTDSQV